MDIRAEKLSPAPEFMLLRNENVINFTTKSIPLEYSGTPVTLPCEQRRTLKGNEKQFELAGNSRYRGKFQ